MTGLHLRRALAIAVTVYAVAAGAAVLVSVPAIILAFWGH
jgi:hypothetical protein